MSEPVKPALTAEEWEKKDAYRDGVQIFVVDGTLIMDNGENVGGEKEFRHAVAALALYNQTFGFTHEDVELLRKHSLLFRGESARVVQNKINALDSLADRIAALLPEKD